MTKDQGNSISQVRITAAQIIYDVTENGAYANLALDKGLKKSTLAVGDRGLLTEIVNGTIRMLKHLDWVLNIFLTRDIAGQNPWMRNILRMSLYQIMFMDKIPAYAAVNDAVELTRKKSNRGLARVVNGVLRNIIRNPDQIKYPENEVEYLAVYYSHPEWIVKYLLNEVGYAECKKILAYNNTRPLVMIRTNILKISPDNLVKELKVQGIDCTKGNLTPWDIEIKSFNVSFNESLAYQNGCFYVQNPASMLAASILAPHKGHMVYDLCCGVGGKSTHLAEFMHNQGKIIAVDYYRQKIDLLRQNCNRLGIDIVEGHENDILNLNTDCKKAERVLLDAPCSGLGVLNRRADSRWNKNPDDVALLGELQLKLLQKAGQLVKDNGKLLYSTCTINQAENEDIVKAFLYKNPDFSLEGFAQNLAFFPLDKRDMDAANEGMLTIIPGKYNTDGMFYALMRRKDTN